jgi:transposase
VIIVSEISRLARSVFMLFRIIEFCTENNIIIYSVKDSINTIKKGDLTGIMMVFCFGIAAQIEREMIVKRTVEGIERRRRDGVLMGRPPGSSGKRILDGKEELIKEYLSVGLNTSQIARLLDVDRMTVNKYCKEKNIAVNASKEWTFRENETHKQGAKTDALLNPEKEYILSLAEEGLSNKYVVEKLDTEKGIKVGDRSFGRWLRADPEFYELFVEKYMQARAVRNKDCGKQKQYYKF